ncbi:hypothetical protein P4H39_19780 [Paenibacillus lautus]|nr:hypothetical protein [Paenibacillus lautus]MEC0204850.1 hypothetical protein [Paenibacillus lautus]
MNTHRLTNGSGRVAVSRCSIVAWFHFPEMPLGDLEAAFWNPT